MALANTSRMSGIVGIVLAFVILTAAGLVALHSEGVRRSSGALLRHSLRIERDLNRLFGLLQSVESSERGYLITRDPTFAEPFDEAARRINEQVDDLEKLVAGNPKQTESLAAVRPVLAERLAILKTKADLMSAGRFDESTKIVRAGRGKKLMDRLQTLISDMLAEEERLRLEGEERLEADDATLERANIALVAIIAGMALYVIYNAQRQMNALAESSDALRGAYDKLLEETTRRETLQAQLRQSQKLEALGQLTGGIAHDFNNMLGVIVASLNILRRKLARNEQDYEPLIDSATEGAESAANLVRRLLAFSRVQPLAPEPLDANRLVEGMSNLLRRTIGDNIVLETRLAEKLWSTKVDANELESVIINLAVNARDAMPDGGRVKIETANLQLDDAEAARHVEATPGPYVAISVTDTGEGMPPEVLARAFDPFFTTKPAGKGTGLGLSQAHGFVRQSGGHIRISSEPGRGTNVTLFLPRHVATPDEADDPAPSAPVRGAEIPSGDPGEVILVVEDDDVARRVTVEGIRELGYTALEAGGGAQALKILRERDDVRLMVSDVIMAEMDGVTLAREARKSRPGLRVLHVSGYTGDAAIQNGFMDREIVLLPKPFTLEKIASKIREMLDEEKVG